MYERKIGVRRYLPWILFSRINIKGTESASGAVSLAHLIQLTYNYTALQNPPEPAVPVDFDVQPPRRLPVLAWLAGVFWEMDAAMTADFFRARLETMIDLRHPLAVLATRLDWAGIEAGLAPLFARSERVGREVEGSDLFGPTLQVAGAGVSAAGRPRLPIPPSRTGR